MFKAEWDCQSVMDGFQRTVDAYDRISMYETISVSEMRRWERLMEKITAWVNLRDGLDA